jgi:hypothetical protein
MTIIALAVAAAIAAQSEGMSAPSDKESLSAQKAERSP